MSLHLPSGRSAPGLEFKPGKPLYEDWILLRLLLLKLRALHLDFLHESFKFGSRLNAAHGLVVAVLDGKGTVPFQHAHDSSPDILKRRIAPCRD